MDIILVNSPWARVEIPSLALGILKGAVDRHFSGTHSVEVLDAQLDYVDWITQRTEFNLRTYHYFASEKYYRGYGDWVFSPALYENREWRIDEFRQKHTASISTEELHLALKLHRLAPDFVDELADKIVARNPRIVGFTTTFLQNAAALATAKAIKKRNPSVVTVFGGANCDGPQGAAIHRNFEFVDFVIRGEGEVTFPALVTEIEKKPQESNYSEIPGLCWSDSEGKHHANPMSAKPLPPNAIVTPDYSGFYERLKASLVSKWTEPKIAIEGSRGCWWGEKHHCKFCGLNGSFMEFRSKDPQSFFSEIVTLSEKHRILDFIVVDNIMDMGYITSLLPRISEAGYDLRLHYEIKSNIKKEHLKILFEAGVVRVQPGIESLSSRVLKLMDKGVSGCQNVRMMRDAESLGMTVEWNYLYGFPGEENADYENIIAQMPALHHLQPAVGGNVRIAIERFSPYFNNPELGFSGLTADKQYGMIYDLPEGELFDMAYLFDAPARGITGEIVGRLSSALSLWSESYPSSRLTYWDMDTHIVLGNTRSGYNWEKMELRDPVEVYVFRLLEQPRTIDAISRKLASSGFDADNHERARVADLLQSWGELGLVFTDDGQFVHIATEPNNQHLLLDQIITLQKREDIIASGTHS
jgi:ribosomal peptide maturation radical SAM protein 1